MEKTVCAPACVRLLLDPYESLRRRWMRKMAGRKMAAGTVGHPPPASSASAARLPCPSFPASPRRRRRPPPPSPPPPPPAVDDPVWRAAAPPPPSLTSSTGTASALPPAVHPSTLPPPPCGCSWRCRCGSPRQTPPRRRLCGWTARPRGERWRPPPTWPVLSDGRTPRPPSHVGVGDGWHADWVRWAGRGGGLRPRLAAVWLRPARTSAPCGGPAYGSGRVLGTHAHTTAGHGRHGARCRSERAAVTRPPSTTPAAVAGGGDGRRRSPAGGGDANDRAARDTAAGGRWGGKAGGGRGEWPRGPVLSEAWLPVAAARQPAQPHGRRRGRRSVVNGRRRSRSCRNVATDQRLRGEGGRRRRRHRHSAQRVPPVRRWAVMAAPRGEGGSDTRTAPAAACAAVAPPASSGAAAHGGRLLSGAASPSVAALPSTTSILALLKPPSPPAPRVALHWRRCRRRRLHRHRHRGGRRHPHTVPTAARRTAPDASGGEQLGVSGPSISGGRRQRRAATRRHCCRGRLCGINSSGCGRRWFRDDSSCRHRESCRRRSRGDGGGNCGGGHLST